MDYALTAAQTDRNVPIDFKVSSPMGVFQHLNRLRFAGERKPKFVGQAMSPPSWWRQTEVMTAFDKIMADKVYRATHSNIDRADVVSTKNQP